MGTQPKGMPRWMWLKVASDRRCAQRRIKRLEETVKKGYKFSDAQLKERKRRKKGKWSRKARENQSIRLKAYYSAKPDVLNKRFGRSIAKVKPELATNGETGTSVRVRIDALKQLVEANANATCQILDEVMDQLG